jgi:hypothetical protein
MLRSLKDLERYTVAAIDGDLGSVVDFLVDDEHWTIRYLVIGTGVVFDGRQVLVSPIFFREADWPSRRFHVALTMDKIKASPSIDVEKPVSRQHERDYHQYYGAQYYWGSTGLWGTGISPVALVGDERGQAQPEQGEGPPGDVHLRSIREIRGYHIQGTDGAVGHVVDFIVDDETWQVRYLVVDTSNWWLGKKVLVAPTWTSGVSWDDRKIYLDVDRKAVKESPSWDAEAAVNREYEATLLDYYDRPRYWDNADPQKKTTPEAHSDRKTASADGTANVKTGARG